MMLLNHLEYLHGQMLLLGHLHAVPGMCGQYGRRYAGIGAVMGIVANLVFLEIKRPLELANIVIIRAYACQQRICADCAGGGVGQVGHDYGMVIGAGSLQQQPVQQRLIGIGQLQELCVGNKIE